MYVQDMRNHEIYQTTAPPHSKHVAKEGKYGKLRGQSHGSGCVILIYYKQLFINFSLENNSIDFG